MNLSTKSRYGARILVDIAMNQSKGPVQNAVIAKRQGISLQYIVQIIRLLKGADFISTLRGPKGGHILGKAPEEITLGQIVRLLETHPQLVECGRDSRRCKRSKNCQIRLVWMEVTEAMFKKLDRITIAELVTRTQKTAKGKCPVLRKEIFP